MDIISYFDMQVYRQSSRKKLQARRESRRIRHEHAWIVARKAASLLREHFAASRIVVFDSLLHPQSLPFSSFTISLPGLRPLPVCWGMTNHGDNA
ncbi:hypothetical protein [Desulfonatronovibrio magnus]|uniref:hypothetical protein n=1 Tax=Desulfonatronovibrio magnus TaxID=698827 RepID=UPI0018DE74C9|nr:hypothetical protein [Desulfonatronovibrio magnus]